MNVVNRDMLSQREEVSRPTIVGILKLGFIFIFLVLALVQCAFFMIK